MPPLLRVLLPRWLRRNWLLWLSLLLLALVWGPMIAAYPTTPTGDGERFLHQIEVGKAALRARELPLWNPYDCLGSRCGTTRSPSSSRRSCSRCSR